MLKFRYCNNSLKLKSKNRMINFDINRDLDLISTRDSFNASIDQLISKVGLKSYALMRVCERNTLVNDFFQDYCYIELIKKVSKKNDSLEVLTNRIAIYNYFKNQSNVEISIFSRISFKLRSLFIISKGHLGFLKFFLKTICHHPFFKRSSKPNNLNNTTIIQTWVSDSNFSENKFQDSYYDGLIKYLNCKNIKCVTWPVFYNLKKTSKALKYIKNNRDDFILPETFLNLSDYLILLKHFYTLKKIRIDKFAVGDSDLTCVFDHYLKLERPTYASIVYRFIEKLSRLNLKNVTVVTNHENMITEKMLLLAREKFFPQMSVLAYFHTTKPRNQLCLEYAGKQDFKLSPKPDKIIFNSPSYCGYYLKKYPQLNCENGYAFKQAYINQIPVTPGTDSNILICLSGNMRDSNLVINLLNQARDRISDLNFVFKFHPMNIFELDGICKLKKYEVSSSSLEKLYEKVNKVISPYSACLLESALVGKEVGFVYDPRKLLVNPFDDTGITNYKLIADMDSLLNFFQNRCRCSSVTDFFNSDRKLLSAFINN